MTTDTRYNDPRQEFFKKYFNSALPYDEYLKTGEEKHQIRWLDFSQRISLSKEDCHLLETFRRKINVLFLSGIWCGDCVRQGPMLRAIELACPAIKVRFIDNRAYPELQQELRINGAEKVPVIVSLSEDFFELSRFGDRHLSVYRRKAKRDLGPACETGIVPPPEEEVSTELHEWVDYFERIELMLRLSPLLRERYGD